MRTPLLIAVLACVAWGQTPTDEGVYKQFRFTFTETPQGMQEVVNAMRAIINLPQVTVDPAARTVAVRGTADQAAAATWLFPELDKPAGAAEYRLGGSADAVMRVFYLMKTTTPQGKQEIVNAIRSILEIQRAIVVNATNAIVLRGTEEQIAGAEWMIRAMDLAAGTQSAAVLSYKLNDPRTPAVRIVHLSPAQTPVSVQEIVNAVRSVSELQRVVAVMAARVIAIRGSAEQVAMAEWLIGALDRTPVAAPFNVASTGDVARVFYVRPLPTPEVLQQLTNSVRSDVKIQRAVAMSQNGAIAVRGTVGQVAMAEKLIQESEQH